MRSAGACEARLPRRRVTVLAWAPAALSAVVAILGENVAATEGDRSVRSSVTVTFIVQPPAGTPAGERLFIAGNIPALGPWDPGKAALQPQGTGEHVVTLALEPGFILEYKITRGSWETVEKGPRGEEIANRRLAVAASESVRVQVASWRDATSEPRRASTLRGDVRHLGRVHSGTLGNDRDVWVYLPPSYERSPERRYPVIYFHDGQNVFDAATAFIGIEWGADETLERLAQTGEIEEAIAVAVANTPARRAEYSQAADPRGGDPRADLYLRFLCEELKPRIDAAYRTRPGREHTALVGSSLGGLVSLYGGLAAWQTFGLIGGVSPVVEWADHDLERRYQQAEADQLPLRIWIDMGTAEDPADAGPDSHHIRELRRFRSVLEARGYAMGSNLGYQEDAGAPHNEAAWAKRLPDLLRFLLPPER